MTTATALGVFLLQSGIFALFIVSVRRRDVAAGINAAVSLIVALLPAVVEIGLQATLSRSISFGPALPAWLAAAGFLHSLGMLGPYDSTWWWDHITHTVSAALVAALLYAGVIVTLPDVTAIGDSSGLVVTVTLVFTFAVGVFWELIELVAREVGARLDIEPVLIHYGWRDTALDLGFDVVGALIVVGVDLQIFVPIMEQFPDATEAVLFGSGWVLVVGSLLMALVIGLGRLGTSSAQ